jgi:hypothetical protein
MVRYPTMLHPKKERAVPAPSIASGAEEGIRTPDPLLGKEMLYH